MGKKKRPLEEADIEAVSERLEEILGHIWPITTPQLEPGVVYERVHDDHEGRFDGVLQVQLTRDGDVWLSGNLREGNSMRFRTPFVGGGMSRRTWTALRILALAIKLDNEERPIHMPDRKNPEDP